MTCEQKTSIKKIRKSKDKELKKKCLQKSVEELINSMGNSAVKIERLQMLNTLLNQMVFEKNAKDKLVEIKKIKEKINIIE